METKFRRIAYLVLLIPALSFGETGDPQLSMFAKPRNVIVQESARAVVHFKEPVTGKLVLPLAMIYLGIISPLSPQPNLAEWNSNPEKAALGVNLGNRAYLFRKTALYGRIREELHPLAAAQLAEDAATGVPVAELRKKYLSLKDHSPSPKVQGALVSTRSFIDELEKIRAENPLPSDGELIAEIKSEEAKILDANRNLATSGAAVAQKSGAPVHVAPSLEVLQHSGVRSALSGAVTAF